MTKLGLEKVDVNQSGAAPIPAGTIVVLRMKLLPGTTGPDNLCVRSAKGDCFGIKAQYIVIGGEHGGRTLRAWHLVEGTTEGHLEARKYTLAKLRQIIDAIHGLDPHDELSPATAVRAGAELKNFNGATFLAELGVEPGGPKPRGGKYPDKNVITRILRPGAVEYRQLEQPAFPAPATHSASTNNGTHNGANHGAAPVSASSAIAKPGWVQ